MIRPVSGCELSDAELLDRLLTGSHTVDEALLEALLAEGVPARAALRYAARGRWHLGAALLLGGALALGAARPATARETAAPVTPAAVVAAPAAAPAEVLGLAAPASAARAAVADASLEAGVVLLVPSLAVEAQTNTSPTSQLYTVRPGDTLSAIALRVYGDASYWPMIFNSNTDIIADPHWIYPGQSLRLVNVPAGGTLTPGNTGSQVGQGPGSYTVRPGDSLWSIAQFAYGNPYRWIDIYNANAARIGPNASLIFSGTVLTIPA